MWRLNTFPLLSGTKQDVHLHYHYSCSIGSASQWNKARRTVIRGIQIGKQEIGLICRWYDDVHRNSQGTYQKKIFLKLVSEFAKSEDTTLTYIR